jgi:hypothetical protein
MGAGRQAWAGRGGRTDVPEGADASVTRLRQLQDDLNLKLDRAAGAHQQVDLDRQVRQLAMLDGMNRYHASLGITPVPFRQIASAAQSAAVAGIRDAEAFVARLKLNRYVKDLDLDDPKIRRTVDDIFHEQSVRADRVAVEHAVRDHGPPAGPAMKNLLDRGLTINQVSEVLRKHGARGAELTDSLMGRQVSFAQATDLLDRYGTTGAATVDGLLAHGGRAVGLPEAITIVSRAHHVGHIRADEVFGLRGTKLDSVPPSLKAVPETVERLVRSGRLENPIYLQTVLRDIRNEALSGKKGVIESNFGKLQQLEDAAERATRSGATRPVAVESSTTAERGFTRRADVIDQNRPRLLPGERDPGYRGEAVAHKELPGGLPALQQKVDEGVHQLNGRTARGNPGGEVPPTGARLLVDIRFRNPAHGGSDDGWDATREQLLRTLRNAPQVIDRANRWHEIRITNGRGVHQFSWDELH